MEKGFYIKRMRDRALSERYWQEAGANPEKGKCALVKEIIESAAPRFFVTREETCRTCSRILRGGASGKKGLKDEMFREISERLKEETCQDTTRNNAVEQVILSQAPRWYIKLDTALRIVNRCARERE